LDSLDDESLVELKKREDSLPVNKKTGHHDIGFDVDERNFEELLQEKGLADNTEKIISTLSPSQKKETYVLTIEDVPYDVSFPEGDKGGTT